MRAFLAIPLPSDARRAAVSAQRIFGGMEDGWRFAREDGLHLTVRFLGDVDPSRRPVLDAAWREAAKGTGPLTLRVAGASVLPTSARPRVVWLNVSDETPDGRLSRLAGRVEAAARALGFPHEDRPFAAHVTLARARRGGRASAPPVLRVGDLGAFVADRLVLFRSELSPGGSRYFEEASYALAHGEGV